jgi:hypothetical protein
MNRFFVLSSILPWREVQFQVKASHGWVTTMFVLQETDGSGQFIAPELSIQQTGFYSLSEALERARALETLALVGEAWADEVGLHHRLSARDWRDIFQERGGEVVIEQPDEEP